MSISPLSTAAELILESPSENENELNFHEAEVIESEFLCNSTEEVMEYLDLKFGAKQYVYQIKREQRKDFVQHYYYAKIECTKSGLPRRRMVRPILHFYFCVNNVTILLLGNRLSKEVKEN